MFGIDVTGIVRCEQLYKNDLFLFNVQLFYLPVHHAVNIGFANEVVCLVPRVWRVAYDVWRPGGIEDTHMISLAYVWRAQTNSPFGTYKDTSFFRHR